MIRDADAAMYLAKDRGRGRIEVFDSTMREAALQRLETGNGLHRALTAEQFRVHYQPIVRAKTGEIVSLEALVRWQHPERGLIAPGHFIDRADELGVTAPIGEFVLDTACAALRTWRDRDEGRRQLSVSVNISARQLRQAHFDRTVERMLVRHDLEPWRLCLEVTENVMLEHAEAVARSLHRLRRLGVRLSIDDFGAGYTSLSYLKRFPVDVLKIDRSFVTGICDQREDAAIVSAVIDLAHTFDTRTVAEGVEDAEQLAALVGMGCDYVQGFYFSEPLPSEEVAALLTTQRLRVTRPQVPRPVA